jgi:hypothetical protein
MWRRRALDWGGELSYRITAQLSDSLSLFINIHFTMTFLYPVTKSNMIKNQFVTSAARMRIIE